MSDECHTGCPLIVVEDFHKAYQERVAVGGLSFQVEAGQILGLVGRNGAGKTTTMRTMTGIIPPTKGRLSIAGHDIVTDPIAAKLSLAYVPDDPKLFDGLTVWEHLRFIAAAYRVADYEPVAERLLSQFELLERSNTLSQELSRGMRQKVAVCCALLHSPRVILLDEPLTGLDPRGIRTLKEMIRQRAADGSAVILSSHLLVLVEDVCTHYLILDRGCKRFGGNIHEARSAFAESRSDASLEEIFFRAIDEAEVEKPDKV